MEERSFQKIAPPLKGLDVVVYLDDLLITGQNEKEHLRNFQKLLQLLLENRLSKKVKM